MEVILREDVPTLGTIGDIVRVKPGFARNYLLPRGLAVVADRRNVHALEHQQRLAAEKRERERRQALSVAEKLSHVRVTIKARAGEEGKLFGSVTNIDIERALAAEGIQKGHMSLHARNVAAAAGAIGEEIEIRPAFTSASWSPTIW